MVLLQVMFLRRTTQPLKELFKNHICSACRSVRTFIVAINCSAEAFQDQDDEFLDRRCQEGALEEFSHSYCGERFHTEMESVRPEDWCTLTEVIRWGGGGTSGGFIIYFSQEYKISHKTKIWIVLESPPGGHERECSFIKWSIDFYTTRGVTPWWSVERMQL